MYNIFETWWSSVLSWVQIIVESEYDWQKQFTRKEWKNLIKSLLNNDDFAYEKICTNQRLQHRLTWKDFLRQILRKNHSEYIDSEDLLQSQRWDSISRILEDILWFTFY